VASAFLSLAPDPIEAPLGQRQGMPPNHEHKLNDEICRMTASREMNAKVPRDSYAQHAAEPDRPNELRRMILGERAVYDNEWGPARPGGHRNAGRHPVRTSRGPIADRRPHVVINDEDRVFMLWRHRIATNEWGRELPGGILDPGEDPADCAVREVVEETGLATGSGRASDLVPTDARHGRYPHVVCLVRSASR